jgi:hypothetical protein
VDVVFALSSADTTPPIVVATAPADGATEVGLAASVTASFDEAMDASTIVASAFDLSGSSSGPVAATVTYDAATQTATLTPSQALGAGQTYTATIRGGATGNTVKDVAGNALAASVAWSFATVTAADTTPPTVTSTTPANGSTDVGTTAAPTVTFDEDMEPSTITESSFELRTPSNALVPAAVAYDAASRTATLTPSATLAFSTTYTATVQGGSAGVKDLSGNALASPVSWRCANW